MKTKLFFAAAVCQWVLSGAHMALTLQRMCSGEYGWLTWGNAIMCVAFAGGGYIASTLHRTVYTVEILRTLGREYARNDDFVEFH